MRITTCLTSAMVPLKVSGSAVDAAGRLAVAGPARGPPLQPAVTAAAAPSPVYCRNRRRLRPGANPWPAGRGDHAAPGGGLRASSELVIAGVSPRFGFASHGGQWRQAGHWPPASTPHRRPCYGRGPFRSGDGLLAQARQQGAGSRHDVPGHLRYGQFEGVAGPDLFQLGELDHWVDAAVEKTLVRRQVILQPFGADRK